MKPALDRFLYGAAYYPEHWNPRLWTRDARLMKEAGFNTVRLAEFAWCFLEPEEGRFDFQWLDDAIAILHRAGLQTILGTPTATIPAWMARRYPDVMALDGTGNRRAFEVRKDYCFAHPDFERLAMRIVEQMARRYGHDPRVIAFQTDNEFVASRCRCPLCRAAFRAWLKRRYRTIAALNRAWGTGFWGTRYGRFDEIGWAADRPNPSHMLDQHRFLSWQNVDHQARQIAILRHAAPGKPLTHNAMGLYPWVNYFDLFEDLDFVSWDNYPGWNTRESFGRIALNHAVMRGLKNRNFVVMEQQSGAGGWEAYNRQTAPGQTALLAWQAIARGADGISYFRWRTSVSGQEQYWHGILNHDNVPRRRYAEVAELGRTLKRLGPRLLGTAPESGVGLYYNYDQVWAGHVQPQNRETPLSVADQLEALSLSLAPLAVPFEVFGDSRADWAGLKLVLCPPLTLADPALVAKMTAYVKAGGHLVLTARTGVKNLSNLNLMQPLPGPFAALAGVEVDEYDVVLKDCNWTVQAADFTIKAAVIREHVMPQKDTQVIGRHHGGYMEGWPAITLRMVGKGAVWYVGTLPDREGWSALLKRLILPLSGAPFREDIPDGVEIARRTGKGRAFTFILNHTDEKREVTVSAKARDLLTGKTVSGSVRLPPFGAAVLDR